MHRIGVISDTHRLLRPEAIQRCKGVAHIIHAGDIGQLSIINDLRKIAPCYSRTGECGYRGLGAQLPGDGCCGTRRIGFLCCARCKESGPGSSCRWFFGGHFRSHP